MTDVAYRFNLTLLQQYEIIFFNVFVCPIFNVKLLLFKINLLLIFTLTDF